MEFSEDKPGAMEKRGSHSNECTRHDRSEIRDEAGTGRYGRDRDETSVEVIQSEPRQKGSETNQILLVCHLQKQNENTHSCSMSRGKSMNQKEGNKDR
ncbi:hypothetical protein X801_04154 [Opisthorchis viverrini]|uniref:Uncharacterized protein n=1 Tax=Opisthorchis viverrini TaxID=6198 RepID=A0A1S8X000_OPIVI|nr:hypothetical protein X801_04154 [Opisthorchis viverrini]